MFGREKRVTAEQLAGDLAARILDPETCREAAARLPGRPTPDPVGSCEMAFAGAATLKHVIADTQSPAIAARMTGAVDAAVADAFGGAHTPETQNHYGPDSPPDAAAKAVERDRALTLRPDTQFQRVARRVLPDLIRIDAMPVRSLAGRQEVEDRATGRARAISLAVAGAGSPRFGVPASFGMSSQSQGGDDLSSLRHASGSKRAVKCRSAAGWGSTIRRPRRSAALAATAVTTSMT